MSSKSRHAGMTLVETLVVIAILVILFGLTASGVQRVREAAARTRCQNNLRQLGLAAQNYHSVRHRLPPGVSGNDPTEPYPYLTWMARLLPYLEQESLWRQTTSAFHQTRRFHDDPPHIARPVVLPVFACPSDHRTTSPAVFSTPLRRYEYGLTSYLGVEGYNSLRKDGLLYLDSGHRLTDATDGTANTVLVGERPPSWNKQYGWWYAGSGMSEDGSGDSVLGVRTHCRRSEHCGDCGGDPHRFGPDRFDRPCAFLHFWSPHPGGANFLFADGSVRFLSYSADAILPALATRAGGETVALPE